MSICLPVCLSLCSCERLFPSPYTCSWEEQILTFWFLRGVVPIRRSPQSDGNSHELDVRLSVPDEQLRIRLDVLAGLVVDLAFQLDRHQVLFLGVSSAVDEGQPVATTTTSVDEVTQLTILEDLVWRRRTPFFSKSHKQSLMRVN